MIIMINIFITIKIAKPFIAFILYRFIENVKCTINSFDVSEGDIHIENSQLQY